MKYTYDGDLNNYGKEINQNFYIIDDLEGNLVDVKVSCRGSAKYVLHLPEVRAAIEELINIAYQKIN